MTRRLLAVHAHPDDESSKGAATYAHYRSTGAAVLVVSCTGGERGDVQNPALEPAAMAERDMAGLRRIEMAAAQRALGIQHRWLGYEDSGLPESPAEPLPPNCFALIALELSAEPLVKVIREFRPHVLITYDESGGYPHPDHIRTHELSVFARDAAADAARYPEQGDPWHIPKLYYDRIFTGERATTVHAAMVAAVHPRAAEMAELVEWMSERPSLATTQVAVGDFFEARDEALRAHASQVEPQSPFFFWPNEILRAAWPYEDFQLVDSTVQTQLPETDLFAGIKDTE
ncbi:mycothiol conjugate amidase Mca [soil metagenome]